jgi:hypothetical protein
MGWSNAARSPSGLVTTNSPTMLIEGAIGEVELEVVSADGDLIEPASSQGTEFGPDRQPSYGQANQIPDPPEVFSDGLPAAIWT